MGQEYFWMHGMWAFPFLMPVIMFSVMIAAFYLFFGRGCLISNGRQPMNHGQLAQNTENPLDILKTRYARGDISGEEYERIRKDILS